MPGPPSRLEFLKSRYAEAAATGVVRADRAPAMEDLWSRLVELDPTPRKRYLQRILIWVAEGRLKSEDFYKVPESLREFERVKPLLRRDGISVDLGSYTSLSALDAVLMTYQHLQTQGELDAAERAVIDAETVVHVRNDHILIVEPLTERASCFWGRGTKWCTAATSAHNQFKRYTQSGHSLRIFILPDGTKFQGHTSGMWANASDHLLSECPRSIVATMTDEPAALQVLKTKGGFIKFLNPEHWTEAMLITAVRQDVNVFYLTPPAMRTPAFRMAALEMNGRFLEDLPPETLTDAEIVAAVSKTGSALGLVPAHRQTEALRLMAVKATGWALTFIKPADQTEEMRRIAVSNYWAAIREIPIPQQSNAVRELALKGSPDARTFIPDLFFTERMAAICEGKPLDPPAGALLPAVDSAPSSPKEHETPSMA